MSRYFGVYVCSGLFLNVSEKRDWKSAYTLRFSHYVHLSPTSGSGSGQVSETSIPPLGQLLSLLCVGFCVMFLLVLNDFKVKHFHGGVLIHTKGICECTVFRLT